MRKIFVLFIAVFSIAIASFAAKIPSLEGQEIKISKEPQSSILIEQSEASPRTSIAALSVNELQQSLGRKLSLKEKVAFYLYKKHFKREEPTEKDIKKANSKAVLAFVFSLAAVFIFPLFAIPALILSANALAAEKVNPGILTKSNHGLAKAAKIICYIQFALTLLLLIVVLAIAMSGFR
jgi:hypothetical protein